MNLVDAAQTVERLQLRAAHEGELKALKIARDALLIIVSEGFTTLDARLKSQAGMAATARPATATPVEPPASPLEAAS